MLEDAVILEAQVVSSTAELGVRRILDFRAGARARAGMSRAHGMHVFAWYAHAIFMFVCVCACACAVLCSRHIHMLCKPGPYWGHARVQVASST